MKYSCVSASRSSRTTTKGDLPSDLRILLHSSLSLSLSFPYSTLPPVSLSLSLPVVLQPLSLRCVSVISTIVLVFYDIAFILYSVVMSVSWGVEVEVMMVVVMVMGSRLPFTRPSVVFTHRRGRQEGPGERDWLRGGRESGETLRSAEMDVRVFVLHKIYEDLPVTFCIFETTARQVFVFMFVVFLEKEKVCWFKVFSQALYITKRKYVPTAKSQCNVQSQSLFQLTLFHKDNLPSINNAFQGVLASYIKNKAIKH